MTVEGVRYMSLHLEECTRKICWEGLDPFVYLLGDCLNEGLWGLSCQLIKTCKVRYLSCCLHICGLNFEM